MSEPDHCDIVVVGAGLAGSALAVALSGSGLSIGLIEAKPLSNEPLTAVHDLHNFDPRVSALTPRSAQFLEQLGAWETISAYRLCSYSHMTVWDADGTGQIEFDRKEVEAAELGHIVENRAIVYALQKRLVQCSDVQVFNPATVQSCERNDTGSMRVVLADEREIEAQLVVAADGAMSQLRELMEFSTREWDYGHRGIVATVEFADSHQDTAWQSFTPTGPFALLPLPSSESRHYCSLVWSQQELKVEELLALDDADFCAALERASEGRLGEVLGVSTRFAFPLRQRHALDYVQPGVALVADAAHTIHPLAGQGINLGFSDVAVLAQEVLRGYAGGVSPGQIDLLRRYQRRRKGENLAMMTAMDAFKYLFEQQALPLRWLRNAGMRGVNGLLPIKQQLMRQAMGLG